MEKPYDLLLKGGIVVTGQGMRRADVAVRGETIAAVELDIPAEQAREVVDVAGLYVLPGVIDVHVHPVYLDDVGDCSLVAAYGGTTTLLHYAYARTGESLLEQVEKMLQDGLARSRLDFGLHGGLFEAPRQVPEIPRVMELGVRTFKFFLAYVKQGWFTDDYHLTWAMDILAERGGMALVHAENGGAIDYLEDKYLKRPGASLPEYRRTHPAALEEEAIFRAIRLAEVTGCPLYIPHVTAARCLRPIRQAQGEGLKVFAETCPQYLTLTDEILDTRGALAKIGPPIRTAADRDALWEALRDGTLQVVASDHAPKKKDPWGDFLEQPYGAPGLETLLPVTYDWGVNRGWISVVRLVQVLCENPARIFGLYPKKGTIAVGSDADLVVFDPRREFTIRAENQHSGAGYTLYEGRTVLGWPVMSFQRGRRILWEGEVVAEPGSGRFLPTLEAPQVPPL
ncbi:MAG: amidohydrolase family protein [Anaerolineae bacterium]|nr:amidohydrolase family protein [Anaerolineae bacterium]MCX8068629.1 amidohydrolase family protein [Anaerolineae bacterium]